MPLDLTDFEKADEIVFGPFIGEFGWEVMRWSGFIRWFKLTYPEKNIIVSTRENRQDLYSNAVDVLELFNLEGDYADYVPNGYDCMNLPDEMRAQLTQSLTDKYPNAFLFDPSVYKCNKDLFDFKKMDFDYTPRMSNRTVIESILKTSGGRIPIVVASRDRKDMTVRNWGVPKWKALFDMLQNSGKFIVFVAGVSPSYFRATSERTFFYNLEDYAKAELYTTDVGLTIEAIRASRLTVGSQTATIILSNLIGTQTLFWGDQIKRHAVLENPRNTKSFGIQDYMYSVDAYSIFNHIKRLTRA